ncbi:alpha/beta hydrolase [Streptomyces rimosus]|uniref:alpha/beta hydrolase n=1 Tax=Streptomyces rimosus TaxID=1927 RepID=UPI0031D61418
MLTWEHLRDFKAKEYEEAADGWGEISNRARAAKDTVDSAMLAKLRSTEAGMAAGKALESLQGLSRNFQYIYAECGLIRTALNGFAAEIIASQRKLKAALDEARQLGFTVKPDGSVEYPVPTVVPFAPRRVSSDATTPVLTLPGGDESSNSNPGKAADIAARIGSAVRDAVEVDGRYRAVLAKLKAARGVGVDDKIWADAGQDLKDVRKAAGGFLKESAIPKGKSPAENKKWWDGLTQEQRDEYTALYPTNIGALDGIPSVVRDEANRLVLAEARPAVQQQLADLLKNEPEHYQMRLNPETGYPMGVQEATQKWKDWDKKRKGLEDSLKGIEVIQDRLNGKDEWGDLPDTYLLGFSPDGHGRAIVANGNPDTADHAAVYVPGTGANLAGLSGDIDRSADLWRAASVLAPDRNVSTITWLGYDAPQEILTDSPFSHYANDGAPAFNNFVDGLKASNGTTSGGHLTTVAHSYGTTLVGSAARQGDLNADDVVFAGSPGVQVGSAAEMDVPKGHVWNEEAKGDLVPSIGRFGHGGTQRTDSGVMMFVTPSDEQFGANQMSTDTTGHSDYWKMNKDPKTRHPHASMSLRNQAAVIAGIYEEVQRAD